jgi:erythromycin esterase-like protein
MRGRYAVTIWKDVDLITRSIGDTPHSVDTIYQYLQPLVRDARVVMFGEATHGTEEFYAVRAELTKRLIEEHGFNLIGIEADWPEAYAINRFVRGRDGEISANPALQLFTRFPTWMWANTAVRSFVEWLRGYNDERSENRRVGMYGLDLYSLFSSVDSVLGYLEVVDPNAVRTARERYSCFKHYTSDAQGYGFAASLGLTPGCEDRAVEQLKELRARRWEYLQSDGLLAEDAQFSAEQNALIVVNAAAYYHAMFRQPHTTWNLRDTHMFDTLDALMQHQEQLGQYTRAVVWEHNSHIGDSRATEFAQRGQLNIGQLARQKFGSACCLIGFTTYEGTVMAAPEWGAPGEVKTVREALQGSFEDLLHRVGSEQFILPVRGNSVLSTMLARPRLERAIGVVYHPHSERYSHYFNARLSEQFDAVIHIDATHAVTPITVKSEPLLDEPPETFPSGV